jgi:site-specific DNA recombinase
MKRHNEGKWNGKPLFGYSIEKHPEGGVYLVPNEQATLVTEMFKRYASGKYSLVDLRGFLSETGITKSRFSILFMLRNKTYMGLVPHGKFSNSPFKPPAELQWTQGKHQPLVSQEMFDQVQARLDENRHRQRGGPAAKYLFSGLLSCGRCGGKFQGRTFLRKSGARYVSYRCNRRHAVGDCDASLIVESRIRDKVIPPIEKLLGRLTQQELRTSVRTELVRQEEETQAADRIAKLRLTDSLERLESRLRSLEDAFLDGDIARDRYRARRDELTSQIKELQSQLVARPHLALPDLDQFFALADSMDIVEGVITIDGEPLSDQAWRELVEGLVSRIIIAGHDIEVVWKPEYTPLLALAVAGQPVHYTLYTGMSEGPGT